MERVRGIGGIFFKSEDKARLLAWYSEHLGIDLQEWGGCPFRWGGDSDEPAGTTVWAVFAHDSDYFRVADQPFMVNYRVRDLDAMLAQLRAAGVEVEDKVDESELGRFGWALDCDGNRFELWQPPDGM